MRLAPRLCTAAAAALMAGPVVLAGLVIGLWLALASPHAAAASQRATAPAAAAVARPAVRAGAPQVSVTVRFPAGHTVAVPRSFFGLAMEWETIPLVARYPGTFSNLLDLFGAGSGSPLLVRVGGISADSSVWAPSPGTAIPARAFAIRPDEIGELAAVVRRAHLHLIVDLNLAEDKPAAEARLAAYLRRALPPGSIDAFELGNEPDFYFHAYRDSPAYYPATFSPARYAERFAAYAHRLARAAPGVHLAGPALADPITDYDFLTRLLRSERNEVQMLTVHRYALSACAPRRSPWYPTLTRLLRNTASIGMVGSMSRSLALAHAAHIPIRLDETNSVTCGGTIGVSDTFASALWMTDTLFAALDRGFAGVNVESRVNAFNSPYYLVGGHVMTRPLTYGMLLFTRALLPRAHTVRTTVREGSLVNLNAWALGNRRQENVVLLNKGDAAQNVLLRLPRAPGAVRVQRMLAPSLLSTDGVTLGGQHIDPAGRWDGSLRVTRADWTGRGYEVHVPAFSGALVSVAR